MAKRGKFIALEGIDGSGKSTQIENLIPVILGMHENVIATREPYDEPENEVGFKIRQILLGEEENPGYLELQKMFVEDRRWHMENLVIPALESGNHVLCDRYKASTYAYHRSKGGTFDEVSSWHDSSHIDADLTILVRIPVRVSLERLGARKGTQELFDKEESIKAVHSAYDELLFEKHVPNFRAVNGEQVAEAVSVDILDLCSELIPGLDQGADW